MNIKLEQDIVTTRRSESLFLVVTITSDVEPQHGLAVGLDAALDTALAGDLGDLTYEDGEIMSHDTPEYGLSIMMTRDEVRKIVQSAFTDGKWVQDGGKYHVVHRVLVDAHEDH